MPTVKGPITLKPNAPIPNEIIEAAGGVKLPFKADGWKSTKMPEGISVEPANLEKIVLEKKIEKEKKSKRKKK